MSPATNSGSGPIVTRRRFLGQAASTGASAAMLGALASACGSSSSTSSTTTAAAAPRRGGSINFGLVDYLPNDLLDPARNFSSFGFLSNSTIFEPLTAIGPDMRAQPLLASEWSSSVDNRVWTMKLRPGVEFHNGKPLTSADVVYSFRRQFQPSLAAVYLAFLTDFVQPTSVRAIDPHTVRFELTRPCLFFPAFIALPSFAIIQDGTKDFSKPPGTGPFSVVSYQEGQVAVWKRNPNYWMSGLPYLDGASVYRIADPVAKLNAVISGNMDLVDGLEFNQLPVVNAATNVQKVVLNNSFYVPVSCDQTLAPFRDLRVRQAVKYGMDRQKWVQTVFHGEGTPSPDICIAPSDPLYPSSIQPFPFDPEKAKHLLKQAGYPNGFDLPVWTTPSGPGELDGGVVFGQMMSPLGIKNHIINVTISEFYAKVFLKQACVVGWLLRLPGAIMPLEVYTSKPPADFPQAHFSDPQFDSAIAAALASSSETEAKTHLADAYFIMNQRCGEMIPAWGNKVFVRKNHVQNVIMGIYDIVDFRRVFVT